MLCSSIDIILHGCFVIISSADGMNTFNYHKKLIKERTPFRCFDLFYKKQTFEIAKFTELTNQHDDDLFLQACSDVDVIINKIYGLFLFIYLYL